MNLIVSRKVIDEWKALCKKQDSNRKTRYKILRAFAMGKVINVSNDGIVTRYYDLNIYTNDSGIIYLITRDTTIPNHDIGYNARRSYESKYPSNSQNLYKASKKYDRLAKKMEVFQ